jgi:hypothetical protein
MAVEAKATKKTGGKTGGKAGGKSKTKANGKSGDGIDYDFIGSREEFAESRTVTSRSRLRSKVEDDIAAFLHQGGTIDEIAADVTADPPKKPESNYGSRAI